MSLLEHLEELRSRLFKIGLALVFGTILGTFFASPVLEFLKQPYGDQPFTALGPTDSIVSYFRVSLMLGAIIAIPVITYQVMRFILPGLTKKETRLVMLSLPAITLLFITGVVFTWMLLIPPAINFFAGFQPELFENFWTADRYLGFVTALLFWMGVAFETPLVVFVVSLLGMLTAGTLARNWRVAIVGASVAAALITPTIDPVNMMLVMGPLLALYLLSILMASIGARLNRAGAGSTEA
jgi:sec-independent protein translocase protein TatC